MQTYRGPNVLGCEVQKCATANYRRSRTLQRERGRKGAREREGARHFLGWDEKVTYLEDWRQKGVAFWTPLPVQTAVGQRRKVLTLQAGA